MKSNVKNFVVFAFFVAIELVLMFTPLGYIPIGALRATTMHIPVIICAILLGIKKGVLLGLVFGLTSLFINTFMPTITSFVFSPFITIGGVHGNFSSLIIVLVPRIMLGLLAGILYSFFNKIKINKNINVVLTSAISTFTHTVLVLSGIYVFFAQPYANARQVPVSGLFKLLLGVIATNGVLEMILASIIVLAIVKITKPILERGKQNV